MNKPQTQKMSPFHNRLYPTCFSPVHCYSHSSFFYKYLSCICQDLYLKNEILFGVLQYRRLLYIHYPYVHDWGE